MSKDGNIVKSSRLTRREFLLSSMALAAAGAMISCTPKSTINMTETITNTNVTTSTLTTNATTTITQNATTTITTTSKPASTPAATTTKAKKPIYIGGTFSLTGAYAEDCTAVLAGFEDYVKYVNATSLMAPWRDVKIPDDMSVQLLWRDDELKIDKALSIYDELKGKGMMVNRVSGSGQAVALMNSMNIDHIGATSQAVGAYLLSPPQTVFTYYPIYTDDLAAIADWFISNWKENRKPKVAFITADSPFGRSIEIKEMELYLKSAGFEYIGSQYVPVTPTAPPTTQLMWLKDRKVDLALGCMVNPGSQPTIKEATRLGMGPGLDYKIVFGFAAPSHLAVFSPAMGKLGDGVVVAGSFAPLTDLSNDGLKFCMDIQTKYRTGRQITHVMYQAGIIEGMIQLEAYRLALQTVVYEQLKPIDVLEKGFYQIKNLDTGGITSTPLSYGKGQVEGIDKVRLDQSQNGKVVYLGTSPCRHIIVPEDELW
jgi:hypothetical protein